MSSPASDDATLAVVAHGLLNAIHVAAASLATALDLADRITPDEQRRMLQDARSHVQLVAGILQDLVRGLPDATVDALERLGGDEPPATDD